MWQGPTLDQGPLQGGSVRRGRPLAIRGPELSFTVFREEGWTLDGGRTFTVRVEEEEEGTGERAGRDGEGNDEGERTLRRRRRRHTFETGIGRVYVECLRLFWKGGSGVGRGKTVPAGLGRKVRVACRFCSFFSVWAMVQLVSFRECTVLGRRVRVFSIGGTNGL